MQIQREHRPKRSHPFLVGLVGLVVITGIAFGGALLWQNAQEALAEDDTRQAASPASNVNRPAEDAHPEQTAASGGGEGSAMPQALSSGEGIGAEASAAETSAGGESAAPDAGEVPGSVYEAEGAVPASDPVEQSYFDDAIFFGDSISTGINLYNIATNTACVAAIGVAPTTAVESECIVTQDGKVTMLEAAKAYGDRSKVYIMLGGNGLWAELEPFIAGYQDFIDAVREQYPGAIIYIQSMTPVAPWVGKTYESVSNDKIIKYNAAIAELAARNKLPFVDVFAGLAGPDGYLPDEATTDGMHLQPEYYVKWFDYLRAHTVQG